MSAYGKLKSLGIDLPTVAPPVAAFAPWVRTGNLVYVSGHIAKKDGRPWVGRLGTDLGTEEGRAAARAAAIDILGTLHAAAGHLDAIRRVVKVMVLVNSAAGFTEQHLVANGASELFQSVFGSAHARSAFGVAQVPFGSCVEVEAVAELR